MNFSRQGGILETKAIFKWLWVTPWFLKYLLNMISSSTSNSLWVTHWFLNDIVKYVSSNSSYNDFLNMSSSSYTSYAIDKCLLKWYFQATLWFHDFKEMFQNFQENISCFQMFYPCPNISWDLLYTYG